MARQKKDGVYANFYLDKALNALLDDYCAQTDRTKTSVVERALRDYFDKHSKDTERTQNEAGTK